MVMLGSALGRTYLKCFYQPLPNETQSNLPGGVWLPVGH